jgi:hypothetical protein
MKSKRLRNFLNEHAEKIGGLIGFLVLFLLIILKGIAAKILSLTLFIAIVLLLFVKILKTFGWKINLENNKNKTTFSIQIPNLNLYNILFYPLFIFTVVLWIYSEFNKSLFVLSEYFLYSIFLLIIIHNLRKWILKKRQDLM